MIFLTYEKNIDIETYNQDTPGKLTPTRFMQVISARCVEMLST